MKDSSKNASSPDATGSNSNGSLSPNDSDIAKETAGDSEEDQATDTNTLDEPATLDQGVHEKSLVVSSASRREIIPYGNRILPKDAQCEVQLKLSKDVVVEPSDPVIIVGNDKATWKIAIEDEQPEIVLEVTSKPGAKWHLTYTVGLRESPSSPPVLLAPMNAQIVGNRLIEYNQWINNSVDALNLAKSAPRRRSRVDLVGEIKKLEREQRNVEVAIKNWRIIARLSHLFFDDNEMVIKLQPKQ